MHMSKCGCPHHKLAKVAMVLGGLSVIGFWITSWTHMRLVGISQDHYLKEFIVFALILISMHRGCSCCCGGCENCTVEGMGESKHHMS